MAYYGHGLAHVCGKVIDEAVNSPSIIPARFPFSPSLPFPSLLFLIFFSFSLVYIVSNSCYGYFIFKASVL